MAQGADGADATLEVVSRDLRNLNINNPNSNYQVQISPVVSQYPDGTLGLGRASIGASNYGLYAVPEESRMIPGSMTVRRAYTALGRYGHGCQHCTAWYDTIGDLNEHIDRDHPTCPTCNGKFRDYSELDAHIRVYHPTCDQCQKRLRNREELDQHQRDRQRCSLCSSSYCDLRSHEVQQHVKCYTCFLPLLLLDDATLQLHIANYHPTCNHCSRFFGTVDEYNQHWWRCDVCTPTSWHCSQANFDSHQRDTHVWCSWGCQNLCFRDDVAYREHKNEKHPLCEMCGNRKRSSRELRRHQRSCRGVNGVLLAA